MTQFLKFSDDNKIDIGIVSEPPIRNNTPFINKKFRPTFATNIPQPIASNNHRLNARRVTTRNSTNNQQTTSNNQHAVRACVIFFNPSLQATMISHLSYTDFVVIKINNLIVASLYSPPDGEISDTIEFVSNTIDFANNNRCIIAGDINAKSIYWGSDSNDDRGDNFMAAIAQHQLHIINDGNKPTFDTIRGNRRLISHIDITTANNQLVNHIHNWRIHDDIHLSDHRPITFNIASQQVNNQSSQSTVKWNTSHVLWDSWSQSIINQLALNNITPDTINEINNVSDLNILVSSMTNIIQSSCDQFCGRYRHKRQRPKKWIKNQILIDITKQQKSIYRKIRSCYNPLRLATLKNEYHKLRQQYRDNAQSLKNNEFNKYINGQGNENSYQKVCRILKDSDNMVARTIEGTTNPTDSTIKLVSALFPDDDEDNNDEQRNIRSDVNRWLRKNKNCQNIQQVSSSELNNAINKFKDGKAPGLDGISPKILKNVWITVPDTFLAMYNACLRINHVPYLWKTSIIRILPKPGRDDYCKTNSYRPIGLISVLGKVLERIMANRITGHLVNNGHLSIHQYGFIAGRSAEHALENLNHDIESAITKFRHVCLVSLDIRGAFDHTWHPFVISQLIKYRTPKYLVQLINEYQNDRRITTNYGGVTCSKSTNRGTVQGSMLGPLMWNLVVNDLLSLNFGDDVKVQAYADDVTILIPCDCIKYFTIKINNILDKVLNWGHKTKLTFSDTKTKIMYVSRKIRRPVYAPIRMNGTIIEPTDKIKILGVYIDRRLDYRPHIHHVIQKTAKINKSVTSIARKTFGLSSEVLRMIYHSITEPILSYGAVITHKAVRFKHIQKNLRQLVRPIAQSAVKAYRTSSYISVTALADFPPVEIFIKYRAAVVNARVTGMYTLYDTSLNVDINDNIINDSTSKLTTIIREPSVQPPSRIFIKSIKTNHGIGSAFMVFDHEHIIFHKHYRLPLFCTIQQADLFTMINATCWLKNQNNNQTTYIITNNISTVQHVNRQDRKNRQRLANELIDNIENNIVIVWNKIDKGENWYRKLKKYARSTANNQQRQVDYQRVPMSFIKKFEQNRMLISWNDIYRRDRFGSNIRMICPNVQDARMYTPYINKFVTQTITGHGQFGAYLSKFGISDDKKCCCGHPFQSVAHLINDCRMLNRLRRDYRQSTSHITDPKTRIKLTATFFENIAIFADDHRRSIHRQHPP